MASVNKAIILGNLGADPEIRRSEDGSRVIATLSIATTRRYRNQQTQELVNETEWHRVVAFGRTAEVAEEYLHKGNPVFIEGRLRTRKWQDKDGVDRFTTEIVCDSLQLLPGRERADESGGSAPNRSSDDGFDKPKNAPARNNTPLAEDIPF